MMSWTNWTDCNSDLYWDIMESGASTCSITASADTSTDHTSTDGISDESCTDGISDESCTDGISDESRTDHTSTDMTYTASNIAKTYRGGDSMYDSARFTTMSAAAVVAVVVVMAVVTMVAIMMAVVAVVTIMMAAVVAIVMAAMSAAAVIPSGAVFIGAIFCFRHLFLLDNHTFGLGISFGGVFCFVTVIVIIALAYFVHNFFLISLFRFIDRLCFCEQSDEDD